MIIDSVDTHLAAAGSIDKAARLPGLFLAWATNMQLLDEAFEAEHERAVVRARFREINPSELFIVTCGGELSDRALSETGQQFARQHYAAYASDVPEMVENGFYQTENEWWVYEKAAQFLTARLLGRQAGRKAWWQFWRTSG